MSFNPTTNRVPYGLLEDHERIALAKWPHGWLMYVPADKAWLEIDHPGWAMPAVYRGKPAPREDV